MTVGNYNLNNIWLQLGKHQQIIRTSVVVLLALYLIAFAAELTWRLIPSPQEEGSQPSSTSSQVSSAQRPERINLAKLKRLDLFGSLVVAPVVQAPAADAPKTRLNLTLSGVVASSERDTAAAIIENRGQQNTYGLDEKIDGTNAMLKAVFADRVIIRNGGRDETLMLDGVDYTKSAPAPNRPPRQQTRTQDGSTTQNRRTLDKDAVAATNEIRKSPSSFSDYIAISPAQKNGQNVGYRITPGKKPNLFRAAGFQAGDIIVEINGLNLTDPQQSMEAMQSLRTAQSLQLTIDRGGESLTLVLDFPSAGLNI